MQDNHHINDRLVTVAESEQDFEAEMARIALENAEIEATIIGGDLLANMPTIEPIRLELQVFEKDAQKAVEVLESMPQSSPDDDADLDDE